MDSATLNDIIAVGTRAMSPYNTQPWRFRARAEGVDVYLLRTKNFFLKLSGLSQMVLGHLLENIRVGAARAGYGVEETLWETSLNLDHPAARLTFHPAPPEAPDEAAGLLARQTRRAPFSRDPFDDEDRRDFDDFLTRHRPPCVTVRRWEGDARDILADILSDLEAVRAANIKLFAESFDYIRAGRDEYLTKRTGLSLDELGLSSTARALALFATNHRWLFSALRGHIRRVAKREFNDRLRASGALLVYAVHDTSPRTYVELGRLVQRQLNHFAGRGIHSHPVLSGLYILHLIFENLEIFSHRERDTILTSLRDLEVLLGLPSRQTAYIVRIGRAELPAQSGGVRRPIEDLLLK
jgi:hypothetical protein